MTRMVCSTTKRTAYGTSTTSTIPLVLPGDRCTGDMPLRPTSSLGRNTPFTSTDLLTWEEHPIVLYPDSIGTIFSGSAVIDKKNTAGFGENAIVAIFTQSERIGQHQSIAYSTDGGYTFTKYEGNPVLMGDIADFRDPKVFWDEQSNQWTMALACQQEIRFYGSPNLKDWTYLSSFGKDLGAHGGVWECPELINPP